MTAISPAVPVKRERMLVTNAIRRPSGDHAKLRGSHSSEQRRIRCGAPPRRSTNTSI
jgi:hypothetical protein